jgi:hypothetical protein
MEKSMMVIQSDWNQQPTFKMIPVSTNCPYVECIYDPQSKVLALIGNTKKNVFHMMPKLDDNGDVVARKTRSEGSKSHKEERRTVETFQEYYLMNVDDIKTFVSMFAFNPEKADSFVSV